MLNAYKLKTKKICFHLKDPIYLDMNCVWWYRVPYIVNHPFCFQVLASFGMFLSDEQFNILISKLSFNNKGHMLYSDFVNSFDDPRVGGPGEDIVRSGNHRVNPIRGDEYGMSIDQVERKLASKLRENFAVST